VPDHDDRIFASGAMKKRHRIAMPSSGRPFAKGNKASPGRQRQAGGGGVAPRLFTRPRGTTSCREPQERGRRLEAATKLNKEIGTGNRATAAPTTIIFRTNVSMLALRPTSPLGSSD
jgi:hypothetical protein